MDIRQAKQELRQTICAYTAKTEDGLFRIPRSQQRPVLLMGPPGIGKTAILSQLAQEEGVGLVSYTMTHHTRQSALGLPVIVEQTAAGRTFQATQYTMSEIIAAIYEQMERTGLSAGVLFLDEINCVSETLMPAILQLLQNKTFGVHAIPEGWVIVAAGNPPRYNQSARGFDMATLDRVRCIELEPSFAVWQEYAVSRGVHPAVLAFLRLHPEQFFVCDTQYTADRFVTARSWEDLSVLLLSYETLGFACTAAQMQEYLYVPEIAAAFAAFYALFRQFSQTVPLEGILKGEAGQAQQPLRQLPFEGRLSVVEFLLHSLQRQTERQADCAALAFSMESFFRSLCQNGCKAHTQRLLEQRETALRIRKECGVLPRKEEQRETNVLTHVRQAVETGQTDSGTYAAVQKLCRESAAAADACGRQTLQALENGLQFVQATFGADQELWILLHGLEACGAADFLKRAGSGVYTGILQTATPEARAAELREMLKDEK